MKVILKRKDHNYELIQGDTLICEGEYSSSFSEDDMNHKMNDLGQLNSKPLKEILSCKPSELPENIMFHGKLQVKESPMIQGALFEKWSIDGYCLVQADINLSDWANSFTPIEFQNAINKKLTKSRVICELEFDALYLDMKIILDDYTSLQEQLDRAIISLEELKQNTVKELSKKSARQSLLKAFVFPHEYKVICSQYLIWFGEFLESFGVNALISLNHEGDETQVVVSSKHTAQMFAEIENLFSQYIALPYAEYLPASSQSLSPEQQFMVTQLQTQVNHFKGQLEMKSAAIQLKETTLQSLQNTIQTQQNTIDVQKNQLLLIESLQGDEEVELFGGAIKLGEIEWGPLKICPKKLLNKVRKD